MTLSTTPTIENYPVKKYLGVVHGEVILGANFFRDFTAGITNFLGGRSGAYEGSFAEAREKATKEVIQEAQKLGANVILGMHFDYHTVEFNNSSMLMVTVTGTAVIV
jgi:uncharacterized protein YbjQ (UPF0145 family)